jgi:hypothetical protein
MAKLYIAEYSVLKQVEGSGVAQIAQAPPLAEQTVSIGGSSTQSSAFNAGTNYIRIHTDAICSIAVGSNPTATSSTQRVAADQTEYFGVTPAHKIAVITNT